MFGIMRVEKRGRGAVFGLQIEANRTTDDHERGRDFDKSDINWDETQNNVHFVRTENWNKEITRQIHEAKVKERKGSIVLLDGLYTASPEWFAEHTDREEQESYFRDCLAFHIREYCGGDASKLINAVVHYDETTPHLQVASIPLIEDEKGAHLSAKLIMGGRTDYQRRQDRFFEQVTKSRGLERGEKGIDKKHHDLTLQYKLAKHEEELEKAQQRLTEAQKEADAADEYAVSRQNDVNTALSALKEATTSERTQAMDNKWIEGRERQLKSIFEAHSEGITGVHLTNPEWRNLKAAWHDTQSLAKRKEAADAAVRTLVEKGERYITLPPSFKERIDHLAGRIKELEHNLAERGRELFEKDQELREMRSYLERAKEALPDLDRRIEDHKKEKAQLKKKKRSIER